MVGLVTVRAFRFEMRFLERLRTLLDAQLAAQYTNLAGSQWLSVRLQLLGVLMVAAISFTAVVQSRFYNIESGLFTRTFRLHTQNQMSDAHVFVGLVGLAITYALTITGLLNNILSSFIETEKELVSVERIVDYVQNVPKEESNEETERVDRFLVRSKSIFRCKRALGILKLLCCLCVFSIADRQSAKSRLLASAYDTRLTCRSRSQTSHSASTLANELQSSAARAPAKRAFFK